MKVLICHERYEPDFGGGGEIIVHQTALHLARLGIDVKVITAGDPAISSVEGIPTHRLPISRYRFNLAADEITEMANAADLIHSFNYHACLPALAAGRRTGKPVFCSMLGLFEEEWLTMRGAVLGRMFQYWEKFLLRRDYARTFFLSEFSRQQGIRLGADPDRSIVAAPGVDGDKFRPAEHKDDVVLFAGKLDPRKGIGELAEVARALPQVNFRVISWGSHPCGELLKHLDNVEQVPFARDEELWDAYGKARLFFFPSRAETYGMVLVEAMSAGCAIVSTVDLAYQGIQVPVGDVDAMIEAVGSLWDDRERADAMGLANLELAKQITWERYAGILESTYREFV